MPIPACSRLCRRPGLAPARCMAQEAAPVLLVFLTRLVSSTWHEGGCRGDRGLASARVPLRGSARGQRALGRVREEVRGWGVEGEGSWCGAARESIRACAAGPGGERRAEQTPPRGWEASRDEQITSLSITARLVKAKLFH